MAALTAMLKRRIIPKLQMKVRQIGARKMVALVITNKFRAVKEIGDPVSQAKIFQANIADELLFLNLDSDSDELELLAQVVQKVSQEIFMPLAVGGGVRNADHFRFLLKHGADKVVINTVAVENPALIAEAVDKFGSQCVVVSVDYRYDESGIPSVWTKCGTVNTGLDPVTFIAECEALGAGEIMLTSIDRDGTSEGLDIEMSRAVRKAISLPLIIAGGCGVASHFVEGFKEGGADAVAAGTYFCLRDQPPMQARAHISNAGIPIRPYR